MSRFFIRVEASVAPIGGADPTLDILVGGVVVSSAVITAQTGVGSDILQFTLDSDLANFPSSLSFRFNGSTGDASDVVTLEELRINGQAVSASDLSSTMLSQGQSSNMNVANNDHLFGRVEPSSADLGTPTQTGTGGADTIRGTSNVDVIDGAGGNDRIMGLQDDDAINGGAGNDNIFGGDDNDIIIGGAGNDYLVGDAGDDLLYGQADDDRLIGGYGNDTLNGGTGNDILSGGADDDILFGEAGDDRIIGDAGDDSIYGDAGIDRIMGGNGDDLIYGGTEGDLISAGNGDDEVYGEADDDFIIGGAGNDTIDGGAGPDTIYGGDDIDTIDGGDNDDIIYGDDGNDVIDGGDGVDSLIGGAGADTIDGGNGNDIIHGHGLDMMTVSSILRSNSNVTFSQETNSFYEFVDTSTDFSTAQANALASTLNGVNGHMVIITSAAENQFVYDLANSNGADNSSGVGGNRIWLSATDTEVDQVWRWVDGIESGLQFSSTSTSTYNFYENWGGGQPNNSGGSQVYATMWFNGGADDDAWDDRNAADTHDYIIEWEAGLMNSDNAADILSGDAGDDVIYGYGGNDTLNGGADNDILFGGAGDDTINGDAGDDTLIGGPGNDTLNGGAGTDFVSYAGAAAGVTVNLSTGIVSDDGDGGNDTLTSIEDVEVTNFDDDVIGDNNANTIDGRDGDDIIEGLGGNDTLDGGSGTDTLSYANAGSGVTVNLATSSATGGAGTDTISNFENLTGSDFNDNLTGDAGVNVINGNNGNDTITAGGDVDTIDAGAGDDTINLANGDYAAGESITGGTGTDEIVLTNATTIDLSDGTINTVEELTGSTGNDDVTMTATAWSGFTDINLAGGTDTLNVFASGDISASGTPTVSNIETGNLIGNATDNSVTLTGAQLNAIMIGGGTIDFGGGTADVMNLTSTSSELNTLGNTDGSISGLEEVSASGAGTAVDIRFAGQSEDILLTGGNFNDILVTGAGDDTINGGTGNDIFAGYQGADIINGDVGNDIFIYINGHWGAGEAIDGGAGTDDVLLFAASTIDFTTGTFTSIETFSGSGGNDNVTLSDNQWSNLTSINLASGTDVLNVQAGSDISVNGIPTISNVETGNLTGTTSDDVTTMTGAQLNAIIIGGGTINFGGGTGDTLNITSTSTDLNTLGGTNASIQGLENISASGAGAAVIIDISGQTEGFTITASAYADMITAGSGDDTINSGSTLSATLSSILSSNPEAVLNSDGTITHYFVSAGTDSFTIPTGITSIDVIAWGAGGGSGAGGNNNGGGDGGGGGYVEGTLSVSGGDILGVATGGGGGGGLYAGTGGNSEGTGGGGGGYSGVFDTTISHANSIFVAGAGGGGGGGDNTGGAPDGGAGGASGGNTGSAGSGGGGSVGAGLGGTQVAGGSAGGGNNGSTIAGTDGAALAGGLGGEPNPPTATAGGAAGINGGGEGGQASTSAGRAGGGGGGAGYYGGGGGTASNAGNTSGAGGGGGSNYIDGSATSTTNTGATGLTPYQGDPYYVNGVGVGGNGPARRLDGENGGDGMVIIHYDSGEGSIDQTTIAGGQGNDDLYGSGGMDIFIFSNTGAGNIDTIYNFDRQVDKLDLSDLLTGYDPATELITDFVQITDSGGNSDLRVDTAGGGSFGAGTVVATIDGVTGLTNEFLHEVSGMIITS